MEQSSGLDNQQERREAAIRLSSFYEGEGTFVIMHQHNSKGWIHCVPAVRVTNADPLSLEEMIKILDSFQVGHREYKQKRYSENHAQTMTVSVEGFKRCQSFVNAFGDFFFGKKRRNVELYREYLPLISACNHRVKEENVYRRKYITSFVEQNHALNKTGISRILNDYTLDTVLTRDDIVSSAIESCS